MGLVRIFICVEMDCGYLGIGTGIGHDKLEKTVKKILQIVSKIKKKGVSAKDLKDAKSFLRGRKTLGLEASDDVAVYCANRILFHGEIKQPEKILEKFERVSQDDIIKVANDIFVPSKISMSVISSQKDVKQKEDFYKNLFSKI